HSKVLHEPPWRHRTGAVVSQYRRGGGSPSTHKFRGATPLIPLVICVYTSRHPGANTRTDVPPKPQRVWLGLYQRADGEGGRRHLGCISVVQAGAVPATGPGAVRPAHTEVFVSRRRCHFRARAVSRFRRRG